MEEQNRTIVLKSYSRIWKVERQLERVAGIQTTVPFDLFAYIVICGLIEVVLCLMFPFLRKIPFTILIIVPVSIGIFLKKVKLEGKNPIRFLENFLSFAVGDKVYVRFQPVKKQGIASYKQLIPYRKTKEL